MASFTRTERIIRSIEFEVPAPWPHGATGAELSKAYAAATGELMGTGRFGTRDDIPEDAIRVRATDESIVIVIETGAPHA